MNFLRYFTHTLILSLICFTLSCTSSKHTSDEEDDDNDTKSSASYNNDDYYSGNNSYAAQNQTKAISNSLPDVAKMQSDLVGRTINEGTGEGYHEPGWTHVIEYGQISDFSITSVITDEPQLYVVETNMRITPAGTSFYYNTNLKLTYIYTPSDGWMLDNVTSYGMEVISNGAYDDSISAHIGDDGWGGTYCLYLRNNSDSSLIVGGRVHTDNGWHKFSQRVGGYEETAAGGLMSGGSVDDYVIDFIVKEY